MYVLCICKHLGKKEQLTGKIKNWILSSGGNVLEILSCMDVVNTFFSYIVDKKLFQPNQRDH